MYVYELVVASCNLQLLVRELKKEISLPISHASYNSLSFSRMHMQYALTNIKNHLDNPMNSLNCQGDWLLPGVDFSPISQKECEISELKIWYCGG